MEKYKKLVPEIANIYKSLKTRGFDAFMSTKIVSIYLLDRLKFSRALTYSVIFGSFYLFDDVLSRAKQYNDLNKGLRYAAATGNEKTPFILSSHGANYWNRAMKYAAKGGHRHLVDFFIEKGASDWNRGLQGAALTGHKDLVDFFISLGANDWRGAINHARIFRYTSLIDLFEAKLCCQ